MGTLIYNEKLTWYYNDTKYELNPNVLFNMGCFTRMAAVIPKDNQVKKENQSPQSKMNIESLVRVPIILYEYCMTTYLFNSLLCSRVRIWDL